MANLDVGATAAISIHTALAGCDDYLGVSVGEIRISIHTALAGCDLTAHVVTVTVPIFQSTQPSQAVTQHLP